MRQDGKRPDGATRIPWSRGKALAWDVTVLDTYTQSYLDRTAQEVGAAAIRSGAAKKTEKYSDLSHMHVFYPVVVETAGTWHQQTTELIQEIGRRINDVTGDARETSFLFQQLTTALQRGNAVCFQRIFTTT